MLSSVLHGERAVLVNIEIMRAFVRLRALTASNAWLAKKLSELEHKYDGQFSDVFEAIRRLMRPPERPHKQIGFKPRGHKKKPSAGRVFESGGQYRI